MEPSPVMSDHLSREFWEVRWREGRTPWDLGGASAPARQLGQQYLVPPADVIIPGCGRGHEALFLAEQGCRVTAVDFVAAPVVALRQAAAVRGLPVEALQSDIFDLPVALNGRFAAVLEQTCLAALGPTRFADYEALAHRLLKPGGLLLGVFMELSGIQPPPFSCSREAMQALFAPPRWRLLQLQPVTPPQPARPRPEYTAVFQKA